MFPRLSLGGEEGCLWNFRISYVPRGRFRFFRLRQTEKSHNGNYQVEIAALELVEALFVLEKRKRPLKQEFVYEADLEEQFPCPLFVPKLEGVIAYLKRHCGGNVHYKGAVNVTTSSVC